MSELRESMESAW